MNPKTQDEKFYELASRQLFAIQQVVHPIQLAAIAMLEDYDAVDQELDQLLAVIEDLQNRYDVRRAKAFEERANGQQ